MKTELLFSFLAWRLVDSFLSSLACQLFISRSYLVLAARSFRNYLKSPQHLFQYAFFIFSLLTGQIFLLSPETAKIPRDFFKQWVHSIFHGILSYQHEMYSHARLMFFLTFKNSNNCILRRNGVFRCIKKGTHFFKSLTDCRFEFQV